MTWGQLRMQLQVSAPGAELDLLDEFLNATYEEILSATDWGQFLDQHYTIETQAAYLSTTDHVTLTVGQAGVVGVGTSWTSALVGSWFYRPGDNAIYLVSAVVSTTSLTLDRVYEGVSNNAAGTIYSGASYVTMQHIYKLPGDVGAIVSIIDPVTGYPLNPLSRKQMDDSAGPRTLVGDPKSFCPYESSPESLGAVFHQVEFYPPPKFAKGFSMEYVHAATGFDGATTSNSPLPFVTTTLLLNGARAKINAHLEKSQKALFYATQFENELNKLMLKVHREKPPATLQMANRFTRHRLVRAGRGRRNAWGVGQGGPY